MAIQVKKFVCYFCLKVTFGTSSILWTNKIWRGIAVCSFSIGNHNSSITSASQEHHNSNNSSVTIGLSLKKSILSDLNSFQFRRARFPPHIQAHKGLSPDESPKWAKIVRHPMYHHARYINFFWVWKSFFKDAQARTHYFDSFWFHIFCYLK